MVRQLSKKILLFLCFIILAFGVACSNKDITKEFSNTIWESSDKVLALTFSDDSLTVDINIKPDIDETDIEKAKKYEDIYSMGTHENIKVKNNDNNIKIFNNDELNLEFEIISENEIKDKDDNVFNKI